MALPEIGVEISYGSQHHVKELLAAFIIQLKFAVTGNKLLIFLTALKINLGELGRCVFLRILEYFNPHIVFFGRL